jgi:hypothetical protein
MFSTIRRRMTYANIAATLALVFAMSGGAYAASRVLITSTGQIKPSVLKQLKGKAGTNGAQGLTGPAGPAGATGTPGPAGATGAIGPAGATGATGATGKEGPKGKEGSPWTAGGTLPSGKSETGAWAGSGGYGGSTDRVLLASFAIPLAAVPTYNVIRFEEGQGEAKENERAKIANEERKNNSEPELPLPIPTDCKGNFQKPEAAAGNLCLFVREEENVSLNGLEQAAAGSLALVSTAGATVTIDTSHYGEEFTIAGTWAVTAK